MTPTCEKAQSRVHCQYTMEPRGGWRGPVSSHPEGLQGGKLAPRVGDAMLFPRVEVRWKNGGLCLI